MPKADEWPAPQNKLLASLPVKEYTRLLPHLETITPTYKQVLQEAGAPIEYVCFPGDAIVSLLSVAERGETIEVGLIGNEGMVGASILLGSKRAPTEAVIQSPGSVLRMDAETLKKEFRRSQAMQNLLLPYAHALMAEGTQAAACHRYHSPQERLARWLLMVQDRTGTDELRITQEFIAQMLGTRRATVTEAALALQKHGLIDQSRGRVRVRNRQGLEAAACSCYAIIREQFSSLTYA